jgi:putative tryptophan/tyrosine transport system substrate-binding protein
MLDMKRRDFITLLGGAAAAWPLAARAQQPATMPKIGWLTTGDPASYRFSLEAFHDGLRAFGYIAGRNITIEYKWAEGNPARLPQLADQLVRQNVDVIVAGGSIGAQAAKNATSLIPIVAAGTGDLVELGLVTNLARPGANLTGFVAAAPETAGKRIQMIKEMVPQARRAAVLWNPDSSNAELEGKVAKESGGATELTYTLHAARNIKDFDGTLAAIFQSGTDILVVLNDPFMFTHRKRIVESAGQFRLPAIYGYREYVDDGGLISYGASISNTYRGAATYVDKILKGAKAGELPVDLPTKFELVINLKTAKALGLDVPPTLLARADEVIE